MKKWFVLVLITLISVPVYALKTIEPEPGVGTLSSHLSDINDNFVEHENDISAINNHDSVTIGTANGLSLSTQVLSLALGTNASAGAISAAWITFLESIDTESEFKILYNLEDSDINALAETLMTGGTINPVFGDLTADSVSTTGVDGNRGWVTTANTNRTPGGTSYEQYSDIAAGGWVFVNGDGVERTIGSDKPLFQTDASGAIVIVVNSVNYGTDTGDADIPDGACDAASDVGNWVVLISSTADQYSLTSNDASNYFILDDNTALDAGDELDIDGTMVSVMCVEAEKWKVVGYIDTAPTDGGAAD